MTSSRKILGLDLGTNSIGWAIVDEGKEEILGMGSRIFPEGVKAETIGQGDREVSKNAARRESRQMRRQFYRKRLRKIKLLRTLIDFDMCPLSHEELNDWAKWEKSKGKAGRKAPSSSDYMIWQQQNPYELREKALHADLTLYELGRVLYHLIQRRGFLSSRKGNDDGAIYKGKPGMVGIDDTEKQIKEGTLGSFLMSIYPKQGEPFKKLIDEQGNELRVRARYTLRDMYVEEFHQIWERQESVHKLDSKQAIKSKKRFVKGSLESKRNINKIEKINSKYGSDNFETIELKDSDGNINGYKIITKSSVSLKEFLGGKIENDKEGNIKHQSKESVLFWQRELRSQKGLLDQCRFEATIKDKNGKVLINGKNPSQLSHPLFEEFRAWQFINNIEFGKNEKLDDNQRIQILELINSKDANFNFSEIPKKLKLEFVKWNFLEDAKVPGNPTIKNLQTLFKPDVLEKHRNEIWHCFHFYDDNDLLIAKLKKDFGLLEKDEEKAKKIKLKEGYSNVSLKAISRITPYLERGFQMSEATLLGGVRNSFCDRWDYFKTSHQTIEKDILAINRKQGNKEGQAIAEIKEYLVKNDFGFKENDLNFLRLYHHSQEIVVKELKEKLDSIENLRNPIVQHTINETRRLVNQLIKEYGKFDSIHVEMGRNVKNSKKGRQEQSNRINENTNKNDVARKLLTEYGLKHDRNNIQKVLLYKEMQERGVVTICPYTNKAVNISDVLGSQNKFQIEHIIPKSVSLDDSFGNKTICETSFNGLKGNLTPYQFYLKNPDTKLWSATSWEEIEQRVFRVLPYKKAKKFTAKLKENDEVVKNGFIERQLNDTRYIGRKTKEIMSQICNDVKVFPGGLTSELRHLWGLNNILQPTMLVDIPNYKIEDGKSIPHYVVLDEKGIAVESSPIYNDKPKLGANQTAISGKIEKAVFTSNEKFVNLTIRQEGLSNGDYWLNVNLSEPKNLVRIFRERPDSDENQIVLRGRIEKEKFKNDGIGAVSAMGNDNGSYWAQFTVTSKIFEKPEKDKTPKKTTKQLLLYGEVKNGLFNSYIYSCETDELDGRYWLLLDVDFESAYFEKAINERPVEKEKQIIIEGSINDNGVFVSEMDMNHTFLSNEKQGKYWVVFDLLGDLTNFTPQEVPKPILESKQKLVEGSIWIDKHTGEIRFDPKKNREDHRHHAIDALVIALSKQSYFQQLSIYNANRVLKRKVLTHEKEQLNFPEPWDSFHKEATQLAQGILISHKQNNQVLTQVRKKIVKDGQVFKSVGDSVRGQLHKENVYGRKQAPSETTKGYHRRKYVADLKDNQVDKIVDLEIRKIIQNAREEEKGIKKQIDSLLKEKKKSRTEEEDNLFDVQIEAKRSEIVQLYTLKNTKGGERVPIKKVRIREEMSNAQPLKEDLHFVNPRNNHHVVILESEDEELSQGIISFWEVVHRKKHGELLYQSTGEKLSLKETLEANDMFLLGLNDEEIFDNKFDSKYLSKHLFRVQKISNGDYSFRHHLASTLTDSNQEIRISSMKKWKEMNPVKVSVYETGKIEVK